MSTAVARAKFKVDSKTQHLSIKSVLKENGNGYDHVPVTMHTIKLSPVQYDPNNNENSQFWAASPNGNMELGWINEEAANKLELGKEYYIDFTPADQ